MADQPDYGQAALNTAGQQQQGAIGAGVSGVKDTAGQGQGYINSFNPTDVSGRQLGSGAQTAGDYLNQYTSTLAGMPQMTQAYQKANQLYNVQPLQQQANYLNQQVANQYPEQVQLARGFDVSAPQVQNATNQALQFLQPQASAATQNANTAQGLAQGYVGQQQAQNQFMAQPMQAYGQFLSQAQNNEFQALTAKMQSGVGLSQAEMAQLSALQQAAAANATTLGTSGANYASTISGQQNALQQAQLAQQYQKVKTDEALVNTGVLPGTSPTVYSPFATGLSTKAYQVQ